MGWEGGGWNALAVPGFYYRGGQLNGRDIPSRVPTGPANACWFLVQMPEAKSSCYSFNICYILSSCMESMDNITFILVVMQNHCTMFYFSRL